MKKYNMAVTAILKNEARYIEDWLDFHLNAGVEHFYLYNNESDDNLLEELYSFRTNGVVDLLNIKGRNMQMPVYNHAIENFGKETRYMAVIDGDEYLFSVDGAPLHKVCDSIIQEYNGRQFRLPQINAGGIGVNWRMYGTSNHLTPTTNSLVDNFTMRAKDNDPENIHVKSIVIPEAVDYFDQPHVPRFKDDYAEISEHGSYIVCPYFPDGSCDKLRINHYGSKSEEEFHYKLYKRGWPDHEYYNGDEWSEMRMNLARNEWNEVYDPIAKNIFE